MSKPLGNPLVTYNKETKKFEPYVLIGFNNLLLNTELQCPGDNTKYFIPDKSILTVEENNDAISNRALKVSPKYEENPPKVSWSKNINNGDINCFSIDIQKNMYIGTNDNLVKKLDKSGNTIWQYTSSAKVLYIDTDNDKNVYYISNDKKLVKLSETGTLICQYTVFSYVPSGMVYDKVSNRVFVVDGKNVKIISNNEDSFELLDIENITCNSISNIKSDNTGNIYILFDGYLRKYNPEFKVVWEYRCIDDIVQVKYFSVDIDRNVYVIDTSKKIMKISSSGVYIWEYVSNGFVPSSCNTDKLGYLYITGSNKDIKKIDPNGNLIWSITTTNIPLYPILDDIDGLFYIDNTTHYLYKISMTSIYYKPKVYQQVYLHPSRIYTISFLFKSIEQTILNVAIGSSNFNITVGEKDVNKYGSYVYTFETPKDIDINKLYDVSFKMTEATNMYLSDIKLEEGNMNTTWCSSSKDERIRYETHGNQTVFDSNGVHGFRYNKDEGRVEVSNGQDWIKAKLTSSVGGIVIGGKKYFSNATVNDSTAENLVVQATSSSSSSVKLFETSIEDVILGRYSCMLRLKTNNRSITSAVLKIEVYHRLNGTDTKLAESYIKGTDFDTANVWKSMGFVFDFKGNSNLEKRLVIKGFLQQQSQSSTISLDYLLVNFVYTNVGAIQTIKY